jgi:hypothetical protein
VTPEFDPAVVQVLGTFRHLLNAPADGALDVDAVIAALLAQDERIGAALSSDRPRAAAILERLVADGLLEVASGDPSSTSAQYRLTALGRARLGRTETED